MQPIESDNREALRQEIVRRFNSPEFLTAAITKATRDAIRHHKAIGNPIATWKDGKVLIIQPEDIVIPED
jgi:glutaredoxin-related protein